jgi:uncharacterized membrane protein
MPTYGQIIKRRLYSMLLILAPILLITIGISIILVPVQIFGGKIYVIIPSILVLFTYITYVFGLHKEI